MRTRTAGIAVVLFTGLAVADAANLLLPSSNLVNQGNQKWIARRHKGDKNGNQDVAIVLRIAQGSSANKVTGKIWLYNDANAGKYSKRTEFDLPNGDLKSHAGNKRGRQSCKLWKDGNPGIIVFASSYPMKVPGNADPARKDAYVLVRYKEGNVVNGEIVRPAGKSGDAACESQAVQQPDKTRDCDQEPNEDVLEEEDVDTGNVEYTNGT